MKNLKAISPLIAVVMLIGFTLLIAGILGSMATQFALQQRQQIQYCTGARVLLLGGSTPTGSGTVTFNVHNFGDVDLTFSMLETFANGTVSKVKDGIAVQAGDINQVTLTGVDMSAADEFTIRSNECAGAQDLLRVEDIRVV